MLGVLLNTTPSITQLSQIIVGVTAPAFILGAVAAFVAVLINRMNRIIDRSQMLNAIHDEDARAHLKADIPRLKHRAMLLNKAIFYSTLSAIVTATLIMVAFASAFLRLKHEYGFAVLFFIALAFFTAAMINLARDTRIALCEYDHYR